MAAYRGVIFDVDGTLVDSNAAHARAWVEALGEHGHHVTLERVRHLIGMGSDQLLPEVAGLTKDSPEGEQIASRRGAIFKQRYLPTLTPLPGARALVARLRADGVKLVVASSAAKDELGPLLELAEVDDLLREQTSADDAAQSKPEPDIVVAALKRLALAAEETVMIGDTPYDVEAAGKAGVRVIGLRSGGWDDAGLRGALAVYDHPADLLAHYADSPLGSGA
ncbi:MAG: HAD family hydrolase [Chloroflexales bacterium]|nr:HAD family hydrolase [Chloroflexales bacterium]